MNTSITPQLSKPINKEPNEDISSVNLNEPEAKDEPSSTTLKNLLKTAMTNKKNRQELPGKSKKIDKGQKIGMPPRGTRRAMGKR